MKFDLETNQIHEITRKLILLGRYLEVNSPTEEISEKWTYFVINRAVELFVRLADEERITDMLSEWGLMYDSNMDEANF